MSKPVDLMALGSKYTLTMLFSRAISLKAKSMGGVVASLLRVKYSRDPSRLTVCVVKAFISGLMVVCSLDLSKEAGRMAKAYICGPMGRPTMVSSRETTATVLAFSITQMVSGSKACGKKAKNTERVSMFGRMARSITVCTRKVTRKSKASLKVQLCPLISSRTRTQT
jgi:hypothetical protein